LVKIPSDRGIFAPARNGPKVSLLGDEVVAAVASDYAPMEVEGGGSIIVKTIEIYLKNQTDKQLAKRLGLPQSEAFAKDEVQETGYTFVQKTSPKTTIMIFAADPEIGDGFSKTIKIKHQSLAICQVEK
jgi:hypothetical protein